MRRLKIGVCLAPCWTRGQGWRHPESRVEGIFSSGLQSEAARLAEAAHLDFLWKPDSLLLDPKALETGPALSGLEPVTLMGLLAGTTRRIGLVPSISSVYAQPFTVARQLQTLDLLSAGRIGWNVVRSLGGGDNYGDQLRPHDPTANAHDFIEAVEGLRQSFPADSLKMERDSGRFADISQVRHLDDAAESLRLQRRPLILPGLSLCLADTAAGAQVLSEKDSSAGGPHHWRVVGTVGDAVNAIVERARVGVLDGLLVLPTGSWRSLELFTSEVVPALAALGLFREDYSAVTLAGHLAED